MDPWDLFLIHIRKKIVRSTFSNITVRWLKGTKKKRKKEDANSVPIFPQPAKKIRFNETAIEEPETVKGVYFLKILLTLSTG